VISFQLSVKDEIISIRVGLWLVRKVDMADNRDDEQAHLNRLLSIPPDGVLAMFLHDLKRYTGSIEGCVELLSEKELIHEQDHILEILQHSVIAARDMYNAYLVDLNKLQEIRKSGDASH
jgi:hypothetical protein